jgi:hypothetical protein
MTPVAAAGNSNNKIVIVKVVTNELMNFTKQGIFETFIFSKLFRNFTSFMNPENSLQCSQEPVLNQLNPIHTIASLRL